MKKLCGAHGVSGNEGGISSAIMEMISPYVDECKLDKLGNVIAVKRGSGAKKKVAFTSHMDCAGYIVTHIEKNGNLRFSPLGESSPAALAYSRVVFPSGEWGIAVPDKRESKELAFADMHIEAGRADREDAEKAFSLGDTFTLPAYADILGDKITSSSLDGRLGCAILIKAILKAQKPVCDTYFVFTVENLLGARGAKASVLPIDPDVIISVGESDTQAKENENLPPVSVGKGATALIKDKTVICDEWVVALIRDIAEKKKIPLQNEFSNIGLSDLSFMQVCGTGAAIGSVRTPIALKGTGAELASPADADCVYGIITELIKTDFDILGD